MLGTLDWAIIALYFLILLGIVYWTSRRNESTDDYFLAGRNVGWFAIGASLFASNIGSEHIVRWARRGRGQHRDGDGSLGTARVGHDHARLGLRAVLLQVGRVDDAGSFSSDGLDRQRVGFCRWCPSRLMC